MSQGKTIFFELIAKVEQSGLFQEILSKQLPKYQIAPNKCEWLQIKNISNIYENIELKQKTIQEPVSDFQIWNDNQKKVFIWFIIFHSYYLEKQGNFINEESWPFFSKIFFNRNPRFLHFHYLNLLKPDGKIVWTPEEDAILTEAVEISEEIKWNEVSRYVFFKSNFEIFKSSKHCRERWLNHLDQKKKHGNWSPQEDLIIFNFVAQIGKKWSKLVPILNNTRTQHMIKNRYNSLVTKLRGNGKKEREDLVIQKVIKHIKKQLANLERRKQRKEEKNQTTEIVPTIQTTSKAQENHQTPQSIEKGSLPSSQDDNIKKEDSQAKIYIVPESIEKEQKQEKRSQLEAQPAILQEENSEIMEQEKREEKRQESSFNYEHPYPMPMDPYMCSAYGWYPQPMMPFMMPYGYYPRPF